ncbi:phosphatase PAP2 family protein [Sphingobacterium siyangense]|uniref:phosphatase PAP2 family protein n=1 Tax=Sphingobacterium siyangense TaxID=459529 RepID=UPI0031F80CB8
MGKFLLYQSRKVYAANPAFFVCFAIWMALMTAVVVFIPKGDSFHFVNTRHAFWADILFTIQTYFGDGLFVIGVFIAYCCTQQWNFARAILGTYIFSGLICCVLKNLFDADRPATVFHGDPTFHVVSWLRVAHFNSFPSGHTTSAFAMAATLAIISKNRGFGIILFVLAVLTGYSRVYLGQHFVEDVWFGSILGTSTACFYLLAMPYVLRRKRMSFGLRFLQVKI